MNLFGSICLSDIPRELIRTSESNGKKYISIVIGERRTESKYGYTHYIKAYARQGEVAPETNLFCGELKPSKFQDEGGSKQEAQFDTVKKNETIFVSTDDDLPF